eukprot:TRINITY_DN15616_c0_g1_i2.p3 TRINITY_DN15616_c0_g1~~TRINITY_DN15616_c0_g1_i2.p3  ORF type:complete len:138 (+),score=1.08 TRINITY_DN15616_c0_g1_i2:868-1281(+)
MLQQIHQLQQARQKSSESQQLQKFSKNIINNILAQQKYQQQQFNKRLSDQQILTTYKIHIKINYIIKEPSNVYKILAYYKQKQLLVNNTNLVTKINTCTQAAIQRGLLDNPTPQNFAKKGTALSGAILQQFQYNSGI